MRTRNQIRLRKLTVQRLMGLALVLMAIVMVLLARSGATLEDCDATAAVILAPLGAWLFSSPRVLIY